MGPGERRASLNGDQTLPDVAEISGKPHLVNTLVKERQAGVLIADERTLLDEAAEHLSLDHERVEPLVGAVAALQKAYGGENGDY